MRLVRRRRRADDAGRPPTRGWLGRGRAAARALPGRLREGRNALVFVLLALTVAAAASSASTGSSGQAAEPGHSAQPVYPPVPYAGFPQVPYLPGGSVVAVPTSPAGSSGPAPGGSDAATAQGLASNGIPLVALMAYRNAERRLARDLSGCGLSWSLLAAIGRVESNHGRFAGAQLLQDGRSQPPIVGVALDGRATSARIVDTDAGRLDGDTAFDRAVGPMQFIPSTWRMFAVDGDGDGVADPYDINDAALAAGDYLCDAGRNLRTPAGLHAAVLSYNNSEDYVRLVLDLMTEYARGVRVDRLPAPVAQGGKLPAPRKPPLPPVNPAPPPAVAPTPAPTTPAPPTTSPPTTTAPPTTAPTPTPTPTCPTPTPTQTPTPTGTTSPTPGPCDTPTPSPTTSASASASASGATPGSPTPS